MAGTVPTGGTTRKIFWTTEYLNTQRFCEPLLLFLLSCVSPLRSRLGSPRGVLSAVRQRPMAPPRRSVIYRESSRAPAGSGSRIGARIAAFLNLWRGCSAQAGRNFAFLTIQAFQHLTLLQQCLRRKTHWFGRGPSLQVFACGTRFWLVRCQEILQFSRIELCSFARC